MELRKHVPIVPPAWLESCMTGVDGMNNEGLDCMKPLRQDLPVVPDVVCIWKLEERCRVQDVDGFRISGLSANALTIRSLTPYICRHVKSKLSNPLLCGFVNTSEQSSVDILQSTPLPTITKRPPTACFQISVRSSNGSRKRGLCD
jgi:hypothetical protein